jgi:hypothetical protein
LKNVLFGGFADTLLEQPFGFGEVFQMFGAGLLQPLFLLFGVGLIMLPSHCWRQTERHPIT